LFDAKAGDLEDARMELFYGDGGKEQAQMERVLQLAMNEYSTKQTISLREMTALFNMNTLSELEESLEHFEKLAIRRATSQGKRLNRHVRKLNSVPLRSKRCWIAKPERWTR
jgi:coproporphyrinogen III oxidase-like Fe-S oxidoreductase